ncbi:MAG TPA: hypothetical protein VED59_02695, partial [Acidimicrobiales bacterium]|nr:hypothetical protein [Acidimicrobiales bacterium]
LRNVEVAGLGASGVLLQETPGSKVWDEVRAVEGLLGHEGRVLIRPSGTEPVVRIMVEAPTEDQARVAADRLVAVLRSALGAPPTGAG